MVVTALVLSLAAAPGRETILYPIPAGFDPAAVRATDARVSLVRRGSTNALRIDTGHTQPWPGVVLAPASGAWDLTRHTHLALDVRNVGTSNVTVHCRVDNPGADGIRNCITVQISLAPGAFGTLEAILPRPMWFGPSPKLFGMRGYPNSGLDLTNIVQLVVFVNNPETDRAFEISNVRATGTYAGPPPAGGEAPFMPFIDTFGQYIHRDWPGKVRDLQDLQNRAGSESRSLARTRAPRDWDRWGGWETGPKLEATGAFRTAKHEGKWWLVDPDGRLFWSHGVDCVGMLDATPIEERSDWYRDFPGDLPEMKEFFGTGYALHGHYSGRTPRTFNFAGANLRRKYGPDWREASADTAHRRLRAWAMNTIGNWSDWRIYQQDRTPYVATLNTGGRMIEGSEGYWGKFPDVFDRSFFMDTVAKMQAAAAGSANDPWCIGYFVDNEMSWGDSLSLAEAALKSPPDQPVKHAFIDDLKSAFGDIARLNQKWGTDYASWEALAESRTAPDRARASEELGAFYSRVADTYFKTVREAIKEVAPKRLYLGCRFAVANARAVEAAARHCDVVSFNIYARSAADYSLPIVADVPLIIGEFHFGALDRGMFHTGLVPVADQKERAAAYKAYVEGLLRHPQFIGCHWFQWQDEPTTGRVYDEENYQIGLVDICDTPYPETVQAVRQVGSRMYELRMKGR